MQSEFWSVVAPATAAAFLASLVEAVEAFTIVLAVATLRGRLPALAGAGTALLGLCALVVGGGSILDRVPLPPLQIVVGVLLFLFGMMWLRKAVLRAAGLKPLHDEDAIFAQEQQTLAESGRQQAGFDWLAALIAFKAVLLEGIEVIFIVLAVGAGKGQLVPAGFGALGACLLVVVVGMALRRPLSRVPENTLKFAVGVMLVGFGLLWAGEGAGLAFPGGALALPAILAAVLILSLGTVQLLRVRTS
jgi:uncharacterized membrane protein